MKGPDRVLLLDRCQGRSTRLVVGVALLPYRTPGPPRTRISCPRVPVEAFRQLLASFAVTSPAATCNTDQVNSMASAVTTRRTISHSPLLFHLRTLGLCGSPGVLGRRNVDWDTCTRGVRRLGIPTHAPAGDRAYMSCLRRAHPCRSLPLLASSEQVPSWFHHGPCRRA